MPSDAHNLRLQQTVLAERVQALKYSPPEAHATVDEAFYCKLQEVSPSKLAPVLVRRNHEPWFCAYEIQPIGDGGRRLLLVEDEWRITRVKRTAQVLRIASGKRESHSEAVDAQRILKSRIKALLGERRCATSGKKALRSLKSTKVNGRNSSRAAN